MPQVLLVTLQDLMVRPCCCRFGTLLLMDHGEIKLILTHKLHLYWLDFIVLGGAMHFTIEKINH